MAKTAVGIGEEDLMDDLMGDDEMPRNQRKRLSTFVQAGSSVDRPLRNKEHGRVRVAIIQLIADLLGGPIYVRLLFAFIVAGVLGLLGWVYKTPETREARQDLCVYSLIYGFWLAICVPRLLVTINLRLVGQVIYAFTRVFFAEIAVMAYAFYRGHNNILRRGFSLFPTLEANRPGEGLSWLGEAGYNLRLAALISCSIISFTCYCMELWLERPIGMFGRKI